MQTRSCPDRLSLEKFARGELAHEVAEPVQEHLAHCERCRAPGGSASSLARGQMHAATAQIPLPAPILLDDTAAAPLRRGEDVTHTVVPPRVDEASQALPPGRQVSRYVVLEKLGEGGMGVVYAAWDPELNRKVALKLMRANGSGSSSGPSGKSSGAQQRLLREAQALAKLAHPNVVGVHDVGTYEDAVFIAMEFVEGQNLRTWFKTEPRPWREVLRVFKEAGKGLAAAHAKGLVHRDFKPDNVVLSAEGRVYVLDFGLARAEGQQALPEEPSGEVSGSGPLLVTPLTQVGVVMGTRPYMAQELLDGAPADARSDVFAFAVSLYEVLYGERPFSSKGERVLRSPPPGRGVPAWLHRVVLKGLAPSPSARPASMREMLDELERDPAPRRRRLALGFGAVAAAGLTALGLQQLDQSRSQLCQGEGEKLTGVWDTTVRARVEAALLATGAPEAARAWSRTSKLLGAYAQSLVAARTQACVDTRVKGTQTDEVFTLKMECLDRRLTDLRVLTQVLAEAQPKTVAKAADAASNLAPVNVCNNLQALRAPVRPPEDPQLRATVDAVRTELARVKVHRDTGDYPRSLELAQTLLPKAKTLGYAPLEAEILYEVGRNQYELDAPGVTESLRQAALVGLAGKHHQTATAAAVHLIWEASKTGNFADASFWADFARSSLTAFGGDDFLEANLYLARSAIASAEKPWTRDALELDLRAHELFLKHFGADSPRLAASYNNLGFDYMGAREFEPAYANFKKAYALSVQQHGPEHPIHGFALGNMGALLLFERGPSQEAEDLFRQALALREAKMGSENVLVAESRMQLGRLYLHRGDYSRAVEWLTRGLKDMAAGYEKDLQLTTYELCLGRALRALGRPEAALEAFRRASALAQEMREKDDAELWETHGELGSTLMLLGRKAEADAEFEKARPFWEGLEPGTFRYAAAQRWLGQWREAISDHDAAIGHFRNALQVYEKNLGPGHRDVGEVLLALGRAQLALGRFDEAEASLSRAVPLLETAQLAPEQQGEARFALAQALAGRGADSSRPRALVDRAQEDFARSQLGDKAAVAQRIRQWAKGLARP